MCFNSIPKRFVLSCMIFIGFFIMSGIRVNLNVAMGAMVNDHHAVVNGRSFTREGEFEWDTKLQGVILGSFYYGYMVFQIPGGLLALKVGGARLYGLAICLASFMTILTPLAARWNAAGLITLRVLEGLVLGVLFPCNHAIWSRWAPSGEKTALVTVSVTGASIGYLMTMPITGLLTKYGFDGGWASVFYCFGIFGIVWYMVWLWLVHESPSVHPTISEEEKTLIEETALDLSEVKRVRVPWKSIFTSPPVLGIIAANFALDWAFYIFLISMPIYLIDVLHTSITKMGFLAASPFLVKGVCSPLSGIAADILRKTASTKTVRRCFYGIGTISTGVLILIGGYSMNVVVVVLCMSLAGAATSLAYPAYTVNMLDIAPRLAGVIMGICNTVGTTAGFISPVVVGFLTEEKTARQWKAVFWLTFAVVLTGSLLYVTLMSAERQEWDREGDSSNDTNDSEEQI